MTEPSEASAAHPDDAQGTSLPEAIAASTPQVARDSPSPPGLNAFDDGDKTFIRWAGGTSPGAAIHPAIGARKQVGGYELVRELARGGMGVVYEAIQTRLKRTVAVKTILSGEFASDEQVQRFFTEARSVANLDHPNIVPVYEVAEHGGLHFFSMKLVDGGSLSSRLSSFTSNPRSAAELVEKVARAIHHAHQRGVLHRDLKPGNILLDKAGEPMITDFGLAKIVADDSNATRTDAVAGTPCYMAPEQARGSRHATTATDIWAIGAILYHLLTAVQPFKGATSHETLRMVTEAEPIPPRQRTAKIPRDLETICLKCLQKQPARRYATADALAADLRRFLAGEPVEARPIRAQERVWRWCRRNPGLALTSATALLAAAAAIVILSASVVMISEREQQAKQLASDNSRLLKSERALSKAREHDNLALRLDQALQQCERDVPAGLLSLAAVLKSADEIDAQQLALSIRVQIAAWGAALQPLQCVIRHGAAGTGGVRLVALSGDGSIAYTEGGDNRVRAFETGTGRPLGQPLENHRPASVLAADPSTGLLLVGFGDGTSRWWHHDSNHRLPSASPRHEAGQAITAVAYSDGRVMTCGRDGVARFWDKSTGAQVGAEFQHGGPICVCAVSDHSDRCATGGEDGLVRVWRLATGESQGGSKQSGTIRALSFREPQRQLVVVTQAAVMLHSADDAQPLQILRQAPGGAAAMALSRDGQQVLVVDWGSTAEVMKLFGPDGPHVPLRHATVVAALAFSGNGRLAITGSVDGLARVWSLAREKVEERRVQGAQEASLSRDGRRIAVRTLDGAITVLDAQSGDVIAEVHQAQREAVVPLSIAISPDGQRVLVGDIQGAARLYDVVRKAYVGEGIKHKDRVSITSFSGDGSLVMTGSSDGQVQVHRSADLSPACPPTEHDLLRTAIFSPDGNFIATAGDDGVARIRPLKGDRVASRAFKHGAGVSTIAFSSDQTRLVTAGEDKLARLWDIATGQPLGQPMLHPDPIQLIAFSPAGDWIATGGPSREVRLWNARTGEGRPQPMILSERPTCMSFSADGVRLLVGTLDGSVVLWDVVGHRPIGPAVQRPHPIAAVAFTSGEGAAIVATRSGDVRFHRINSQRGETDEIISWIGSLTGLEADDGGTIRIREYHSLPAQH